ncbi:MAG: hypothetical protein ACE5FL_11945 [Myxococcota bacterium]
MGSNTMRVLALTLAVSAGLGIVAWSASAAPVIVDFDSDPMFMNVPNGFTSASSPDVHFSDTNGNDLLLVNSATATNGSNALAVLFDHDDSGLLMEFDFLATELSLDFGNDLALLSSAGDMAVLTAFLDGSFVGVALVALNRNLAMDQSIGFAGTAFNSAVFKYDVNPQLGLTEAVDNIRIVPSAAVIPEPTAAVVFGIGALLLGTARVRRPGLDRT